MKERAELKGIRNALPRCLPRGRGSSVQIYFYAVHPFLNLSSQSQSLYYQIVQVYIDVVIFLLFSKYKYSL